MKQFKFVRGLVWAGCMMFLAYLLGVEWTWRIIALCIFSSILDAVVYADYSSAVKTPTAKLPTLVDDKTEERTQPLIRSASKLNYPKTQS